MRRIISFLTTACLLWTSVSAYANSDRKDKETAALTAVQCWLKLVDGENYLECWREAGLFFREHISADQWVETMTGERKGFGDVVSRKLRKQAFRTTLPGAPEGEYVVVRFETAFANRKTITWETVAVGLDEKGCWRVFGYFIR